MSQPARSGGRFTATLTARRARSLTRAGRDIDCVVRDISGTGARLRVPDAGAVPERFELLLKATGEYRPTHVRWRRKTEVGISFMPERRAFGRRTEPPSVR